MEEKLAVFLEKPLQISPAIKRRQGPAVQFLEQSVPSHGILPYPANNKSGAKHDFNLPPTKQRPSIQSS
jgi:hypothetical protein